MTLVLGIDPGAHGAFAMYDTDVRDVSGAIEDMPTWFQQIGRRKRGRIDPIAVAELFDMYAFLGVAMIVIEQVGGYGKQPGSSGFVFGYGVGLIYMAAIYSRIPIETVTPQTWKKIMNVPGKKEADDTAIINRADELFPNSRAQFRGARNGRKIDRAEAAMIAKFGGDHILPTLQKPANDAEYELLYRVKGF